MKTMRRWQEVCLGGLGLALVSLTGCQTNIAGMTLPTGHYLQHPPQYFAPSPPFPLSRELATMEAQSAAQNGGALPPPGPGGPAVAPPPVPVAPVPVPPPAPGAGG